MRRSNSLAEILFILCILLVVIVLAIALLVTQPAKAADVMPSVCRDTSVEWIRYQFRNIPESWIDVTGYWYVADGGNMLQTNVSNTFVADALTSYPSDASGIKVGEAVLGNSDNTLILRGTADTLPCDNPVQPGSTPQPTACPAWAINGETGELVCLWSLPKASS